MLTSSTVTFAGFIGQIVGLINQVVALLGGLALLMFLVGCVQYVAESSSGHNSHGKGREKIQWGLVALFVFFSLWGIIRVLQVSLLR